MTRPPRRWWALSVVIAVVAGLATAAYAIVTGGIDLSGRGEPEDCEYNAFDAPMRITGMSPNGKYIVGIPTDMDSDTTFGVWHDGEYFETTVAADRYSELLDINDSGDVLGYSTVDSVIWRHIDGEFQYLKAPDGSSEVIPEAIGADGTVVGSTSDETAPRPVKWSPGSVKATELDLDGHDRGTAVDITENGTIVGHVGDGDTATDAWRWDADGKGRKIFGIKTIPGLPGVDVAGDSEAVSVTGDWVLFTAGASQYRAHLDDPDRPQKLKVRLAFLDEYGRAYGSKKGDPAVYDEKVTKLPGLTAPPEPAEDDPDELFNEILAVSGDGGRIAGRTWDDKEVLWICDGSRLPKTVKASAPDSEADGPSKEPKACEVKALTTLEGKDFATETHVSPDGAYAAIGIAYFEEEKSDSFGLWHDGEYTEVDGVPRLGNVNVYGVNSSGTVIGESSTTGDGEDRSTYWRYQGGKVQTLDMPAGAASSRPSAIGEDGTVVGTFQDLESRSGPVMWKPGRSTPTKLDNGGHHEGEASDVSESGVIVGSLPEKKDYAGKAWMWDKDGKATQLPDVGTKDDYSAAVAIAGDWVLLTTQDNGNYTHYRYNLKDKGEPEKVKLTEANDIDAKGRVYGTNGSSLAVYDGAFNEQPGLDDGSGEAPVTDDQINSASTDGSTFAGVSADEPALWTCD
ncbi:hypothetical protein Snas_0032 [Stackebrandtia nassauensis DSM 44728]|uniref:Uncharacterized protein n=2 Tax=Stackebrandtia TaxID=283810 RepID=D3PTZ6_STANL|nr:hypothetical protein Snas_0032 [Stackebrandtia nassauensis DSM 44728]